MDSNPLRLQSPDAIEPVQIKSSLFDLISKKKSPIAKAESKEFDNIGSISLTSKSNSRSLIHSKQSKKPMKWSEHDSRTFFKCLEIFGMDFSMIKEVLSHKTQRQILRKFHKEKKRNPEIVEKALKLHESNLQERDKTCDNFLDKILRQNHTEKISEVLSDDSLEKAMSQKLQLMIENSQESKEKKEETPIQPLDFYLRE